MAEEAKELPRTDDKGANALFPSHDDVNGPQNLHETASGTSQTVAPLSRKCKISLNGQTRNGSRLAWKRPATSYCSASSPKGEQAKSGQPQEPPHQQFIVKAMPHPSIQPRWASIGATGQDVLPGLLRRIDTQA